MDDVLGANEGGVPTQSLQSTHGDGLDDTPCWRDKRARYLAIQLGAHTRAQCLPSPSPRGPCANLVYLGLVVSWNRQLPRHVRGGCWVRRLDSLVHVCHVSSFPGVAVQVFPRSLPTNKYASHHAWDQLLLARAVTTPSAESTSQP